MFNTGNIRSKIGKIVTEFHQIFQHLNELFIIFIAKFSKSWTYEVTTIVYLQINTVKYDADWEIMNIYENLQIAWSQFFTDIYYYSFKFGLLWISIGLSVFRFIANEYKWTPIQLLSTIRNIQSGIWLTNPKAKKQLFAVT